MRARALAFAAAFCAAGAAYAQTASLPAPPKPLSEAELREAIVGGGVELEGNFQESFCPSGDWSLAGARAPMSGRYAIEGDTVCIEGAGMQTASRQCYRFYIADKQYFRRWTESASQDYEPVSLQAASCS
ncbi:MAG: hypothetical protein JNJ73_09155 [Hyphomonadaceae bacterium]|nr:hypothetical protein [Hyphomonadaceae bacterium]